MIEKRNDKKQKDKVTKKIKFQERNQGQKWKKKICDSKLFRGKNHSKLIGEKWAKQEL